MTTIHELGTQRVRLPKMYHRSEGLEAYVAADEAAVRDLLPTGLYPVRLPGGRVVVGIAAYRHLELTLLDASGTPMPARPHGEVTVGPLVTRRPLPPMVPLITSAVPSIAPGILPLLMAVTTRESRDVGRAVWGFPKSLADIAFEDALDRRGVRLAEGGRSVLELEVAAAGAASVVRAPRMLYTLLDGRLIETLAPWRQVRIRRLGPAARLVLGDHPIAGLLRELGLARRSIAAMIVVHQRFELPAGRDIGPAPTRDWFRGADADHGDCTITYPPSPAVDLVLPLVDTTSPAASPLGR